MKTAMTEWFDELKANYPYMANEIFDKGFNKYLEKEKEQIVEAFEQGLEFGFPTNGSNYFDKTYNQNK
jgi:hypothetical protein